MLLSAQGPRGIRKSYDRWWKWNGEIEKNKAKREGTDRFVCALSVAEGLWKGAADVIAAGILGPWVVDDEYDVIA
jgi:hypothetical protein